MGVLAFIARHARVSLIGGLVLGLTAQPLAEVLKHYLPEMVTGLLFLSALRVGAEAAAGRRSELRQSLWIVLGFQLAAPLVAVAAIIGFGLGAAPWALALTLMLAAPSISGTPNFCAMLGLDPAPALRNLLLGTLLTPLTVLPVFWLSPAIDDPMVAVFAALRLTVVIGLAVACAFIARHVFWKNQTAEGRTALDGLSALLLGVIVIGLMAPLGAALPKAPWEAAWWIGYVLLVNFGAQLLTYAVISRSAWSALTVPVSMFSGNRNIALFFIALPEDLLAPVLIFLGCYQIPMYLTPMVMGRLYRRVAVGE